MSRKLRIAVWYNLPSGGAKRALFYHARGLTARGHHLETWHTPGAHAVRATQANASKEFASLEGIVQEHEVPLDLPIEAQTYVGRIIGHVRAPYQIMEAMRAHSEQCARQIAAGEWDLLFSNTCRHFSTPYIARYSDLRSVLYLQEPHRPFYEPMPRLPWPAAPDDDATKLVGLPASSGMGARRSVGHRALRQLKSGWRDRADFAAARLQAREELINAQAHGKILVNSLFSRESVLRAYGIESDVCYLGVDTDIFKCLGLEREPFVLGLGTIGPTKNVRLAIEAIGTMREARPPLVWVGNMSDDVYVQEMSELAASLGVIFQPKVLVEDRDLVDLLNRATAMVYAPRLEPFGLAPLEANACGCPVVAVAEGGVRETIVNGQNGLLAPHDPLAVGEALQRLFEDRAQASAMGQEAKRMVHERWNLESAVDRLEAALLKVAG